MDKNEEFCMKANSMEKQQTGQVHGVRSSRDVLVDLQRKAGCSSIYVGEKADTKRDAGIEPRVEKYVK